MAVFITLEIQDLDRVFQNVIGKSKAGSRRSGAGEPNVRRPLRGMELKEDTYGTLRVIRADGTELKLFDSSAEEGESSRYSNFILQSVQDARMEKQQIVETFGEPYIYFFGEAPRFIDVSALLLNSFDFNWRGEWWENYNLYLRGTRLVEMGARCYLFYDDIIVEGYIVSCQAQEDADNPLSVRMGFRMFVTNYANISFIGDPSFPIHDGVVIPEALKVDDNTFTYQMPTDQELAANEAATYLKQLGAYQIQQEIAKAQTMQQVQALQQQYELQQLGVVTQGANLLAVGKSIFQGKPSAAADELKKGLQISKTGTSEALALWSKGQGKEALQALFSSRTSGSFDLATAIRQGLVYSSPAPTTNINEFLRNAEVAISPLTSQILEVTRTYPLRTSIPDNYDEYTRPVTADASEKDLFNTAGITLPINDDAPHPVESIFNESCKRGANLGPSNLYAMGLVNWSPGSGFQSGVGTGVGSGVGVGGGPVFGVGGAPGIGYGAPSSGYGGTGFGAGLPGSGGGNPGVNANPLFGSPQGVVLGVGTGYRYAYSRSFGATASVGGAAGGQMGGTFGPGVGGAYGGPGAGIYSNPNLQQFGNPGLQQYNQNPFGLPTGSPYGAGMSASGPSQSTVYQYTAGLGPDGSVQTGSKTFQTSGVPGFGQPGYSSGFGATAGVGGGVGGVATFGGGAQINAVAGFGAGIRGDGAFGTQAVPGSLGQSCA